MRKIFRSLVIELSFVFALLVCFTSSCYSQKTFYYPFPSQKVLGYEVPSYGKDPESLAFSKLTARNELSGEINLNKTLILKKDFEEKYLPKYISTFDTSEYRELSGKLCFISYEFEKQENVRLNDVDADLFIKEFMRKDPEDNTETINNLLGTIFVPGLFENASNSIDSGECLMSIDMDSESIVSIDPDSTTLDEMQALIDAHSTLISLTAPDKGLIPNVDAYVKKAESIIPQLTTLPQNVVSQSIKNENQQLSQIKKIYTELLGELTLDEQVGEELVRLSEGKTLGETFKMDVETTKTLKKGVCRQFANRLISELYEIGIKAHNLIVVKTDGTSHMAVLYEVNNENYVADLSLEIQYCKRFPFLYNKSTPLLNAMPLKDYIDMNSNAKSIAFCNEVLTDNQKTFFTANFVPLYNLL